MSVLQCQLAATINEDKGLAFDVDDEDDGLRLCCTRRQELTREKIRTAIAYDDPRGIIVLINQDTYLGQKHTGIGCVRVTAIFTANERTPFDNNADFISQSS
jgi:hypothetical protein